MALSPHIYHSIVRPKWFTQRYIHRHITNHCDFTNKNVLDFGSGTGANCTISTPGYIGVDPDEKRIEFAKRKYHQYQFDVLKNDQLSISDSSIDIIMIIAVLHHIPPTKINIYLKEFQRILNKNGEVLIIEPCLLNRKCMSNWFMRTYDKGEYIQNEQGYIEAFEKHGFQTTVIKRYSKCFFYRELFFKANVPYKVSTFPGK